MYIVLWASVIYGKLPLGFTNSVIFTDNNEPISDNSPKYMHMFGHTSNFRRISLRFSIQTWTFLHEYNTPITPRLATNLGPSESLIIIEDGFCVALTDVLRTQARWVSLNLSAASMRPFQQLIFPLFVTSIRTSTLHPK